MTEQCQNRYRHSHRVNQVIEVLGSNRKKEAR